MSRLGGGRWWPAVVVAALVLFSSGIAYRALAGRLQWLASQKIVLDVPLSAFPLVLGGWRGQEIALPPSLVRVAGNDDYLCRRYVNADTGESVILYVTYTARPRTMLGHRPSVCYPATGWIHEQTESTEIGARAVTVPCLVHRFRMPGRDGRRRVVLNYYVLNGRLTVDEADFWGFRWRGPNLRRDAARYVAQVQVVAPVRLTVAAARRAAERFAAVSAERLLALLPHTGLASTVGGAPQ